jgi:voltage-gated potassium channel
VIKTLGAQLAVFLQETEMRRNFSPLLRFTAFLVGVMILYTALFHLIMTRVEGQDHSWLSGFYWTVVTMSTLGFGDITFHTDLGRAFSVFVLLSGVVLLLIILPYIFLTYVAGPWLEARVRSSAPREVPAEMTGHVLICAWDDLGPGLSAQFRAHEIPYVVLEQDRERAAQLAGDGVSVMVGEVDSQETYRRAGAERARLVVANLDDRTNTNIILTVREVAPEVPIAAVASSEDATDILDLAGATRVLPLRRQLGDQLAARINAGHAETHVIGEFGDLVIAEFPVQNTPLAGKTVRETRLRETLGLTVVGVWEQGELHPVHPDRVLTEHALPVVVGTREEMKELDELLFIYDTNWNPVIVIGGGKVGRSATRALKRQGVPVHLLEKQDWLARRWEHLPDRMIVGDAANLETLEEAGIRDTPAVLLTTNDDATNVYLAVYCRKLNPDLRIVSRVTHERNVESIRRAGADLVLSYASLGVQTISSIARNRPLVLLGEGVELLEEIVPPSLAGKTLAESQIGARTGLTVVAIDDGGRFLVNPRAEAILPAEARLYLIGTAEGLSAFHRLFDA